MGGFFGVVGKDDCVADVFYGTDYHSHLGTSRGGMVVRGEQGFKRNIHDISDTPFRTKFEPDLYKHIGNMGLGVISDYEDQPLIIGSHLGTYAIVTVGVVSNADELAKKAFGKRTTHFSEMSGGEINPTELVATLINQAETFADGIRNVLESIEGSCSLLLATRQGVYAARDKLGRTPVVIGTKPGARAATLETCAFENLDYEVHSYLGPGEIVRMTADGVEQLQPPGEKMQICGFLWVYYGYPASCYEDINVEAARNRCGALLAKNDDVDVDFVAGIPDSGTGHAIGYANAAGIPFGRPFVKYTPTWPRSFMPQDQSLRDLVAKMKLIPVRRLIDGKSLLFCDDSIVRGTTLKYSIIRILDRLRPKRIVVVSSSPQIRYPDCYGIDMAKLGDFIAFRAAIELLKENGQEHIINDVYKKSKAQELVETENIVNFVKEIYAPFTDEQISDKIAQMLTTSEINANVKIVYQTIEGLHEACPDHKGDWYFTGDYPTLGGKKVVNRSFINFIEGSNASTKCM